MFYKTSKPEIVAAIETLEAEKKAFIFAAEIWAGQFDGNAIFSDQSDRISVAGIVLNNRHDRDDLEYWTKPVSAKKYASWPRAKMPKVAQAVMLAQITERYHSTMPEPVKREALFKAISCSWGDFVFSGLYFFVVDGYAYFKTGIYLPEVDEKITEILGSEFNAANKAAKDG